jgi:hypothetical protein
MKDLTMIETIKADPLRLQEEGLAIGMKRVNRVQGFADLGGDAE